MSNRHGIKAPDFVGNTKSPDYQSVDGLESGETFVSRIYEGANVSGDILNAISEDDIVITSLEDAVEVFSGINDKSYEEKRSALQYLWLYVTDTNVSGDDEKTDLIKDRLYEVLESVHERLSPGDVQDVMPVVLRHLQSALD